jgi:hypothetical protein
VVLDFGAALFEREDVHDVVGRRSNELDTALRPVLEEPATSSNQPSNRAVKSAGNTAKPRRCLAAAGRAWRCLRARVRGVETSLGL